MQKTHLLQKQITICFSFFVTVNCIDKATEKDHNFFLKYVFSELCITQLSFVGNDILHLNKYEKYSRKMYKNVMSNTTCRNNSEFGK